MVISIVTAVWAINFTAPVFVKDYAPSPELNVAFMAIIGVLTASYRLDKDKDKEKDTESKDKTKTKPQDDAASTEDNSDEE